MSVGLLAPQGRTLAEWSCERRALDQIAYRAKQGHRGGRPPRFDAELYRDRNVVERAFNRLKGWRGVATRYDCEDEQVPPPGRGLTRVTTGLWCRVFDLLTTDLGWCLLPSDRRGVSP